MTCLYGVVRTMYGPQAPVICDGKLPTPASRYQLTEVRSVQQWLSDLQGMMECECSILETKPIHNSPLNLENVAAATKENIYRLRNRAENLARELQQLFHKLTSGTYSQRLRPAVLALTLHVRSCLEECNEYCPDFQHMKEKQQVVIDAMATLVKNFEMYDNSKGCELDGLIDSLTSLGNALNSLRQTVQSALVRKLVMMIQDSASELNVKFAVITAHSLSQDSVWLRRILIQENAMGALFAVCRITTLSIPSIVTIALQAISTLCAEPEGRLELEKIGGLGFLGEILSSPSTSEAVKLEAASVLAEITSPDINSYHRMLCFIEHMEDLLKNLTALCDQTSNPLVFLVSASAIANITFMDTMSSDFLAMFNTANILIDGYTNGKAKTMYSKDQVVTIIANMSGSEKCREQIIKAGGMKVLVELLHTRAPFSTVKTNGVNQRADNKAACGVASTCEHVHQKSAIALGRLCQDYDTAMMAVNIGVIPRLVDMCRHRRERNDSEPVLVACLAALRKLHSVVGASKFEPKALQQLIRPRLIESFVTCSSIGSTETFV